MSLTEEVYNQARFMAQELTQEQQDLLNVICQAAVSSLEARLRDGITVEDCQADFVTAAGMYAVAAMSEIGDLDHVEQFSAGDVTIRRGKSNAGNGLRAQAQLLMAPYLKDGFSFVGV